MLINLRNALMAGKRLPYDAEVEYLESTGTQYIDIPVSVSAGQFFEVAGTISASNLVTNAMLFDANVSGQFHSNRYSESSSSIIFASSVGGVSSQGGWSITPNRMTAFALSTTGKTVDGVFAALARPLTSALSKIRIFGPIRSGFAFASVKFAAIKITVGNDVVFDGIPVRKGSTGYFYDRVSGALFGNAGTGDFTCGSDVVPVEYIESHGTEYIDTGVVPAPMLDYSISFAFSSMSSYSYILGAWSSDGSNYYDLAEQNNTLLYAGFGTISQAVENLPVGVFSTVEKRGLDIYVVGGRKRTYPADIQSGSISSTILLFGVHRNYGPGYIAATQPLRVKSFSLVGNGTPVRNFLPVRVGTEGAMMDTLTRRIYRNAGTGAFGYGNDLKYPIPAA